MMDNHISFDSLFKDIFVWNKFFNVYKCTIYNICKYSLIFSLLLTNIVMWKFIRRLFIILVILTIAFLVYRYINPYGASKLVDKIKAIPDSISGWISQDTELNITGTTLMISGDIDVSIETGNMQDDEEDISWLEELNSEIDEILWTDDEKMTWDIVDASMKEEDENLDFLWEETVENCIWEWGVANWTVSPEYQTFCCEELTSFDYSNYGKSDEDLMVWGWVLCVDPSKWKPVCINTWTEQEWWYYDDWELLKIDNNCYVENWEESIQEEEEVTHVPPVPEQWWELTDADYQQIEDVFGNLVE